MMRTVSLTGVAGATVITDVPFLDRMWDRGVFMGWVGAKDTERVSCISTRFESSLGKEISIGGAKTAGKL